ncbi:hypothetical protein TrRE_jg4088 [Triparma retinervis]|uniref:Uncharacterized protein n=1 Tax=Triparma retinervis TaxID=2557542 RepID=A0A9W6ZXX8_9STRA|nr:hypothetical protein TrRE_jg4088 [Triparma retinervis]
MRASLAALSKSTSETGPGFWRFRGLDIPIGVKRGSFTRVTYVMSIDPSTTGFFPFYFIKKNISSVVASYIDKKGSKFDYAPEDFIRSFVDKMLIKVDADAVIGKVFTGSVNYLVWATVVGHYTSTESLSTG